MISSRTPSQHPHNIVVSKCFVQPFANEGAFGVTRSQLIVEYGIIVPKFWAPCREGDRRCTPSEGATMSINIWRYGFCRAPSADCCISKVEMPQLIVACEDCSVGDGNVKLPFISQVERSSVREGDEEHKQSAHLEDVIALAFANEGDRCSQIIVELFLASELIVEYCPVSELIVECILASRESNGMLISDYAISPASKPPDKLMDSLCPNHNSIMSASEGGNFDMATSISRAHIIPAISIKERSSTPYANSASEGDIGYPKSQLIENDRR